MYNPNFKGSIAAFIDVFRRYGLPGQIHTDNGAVKIGETRWLFITTASAGKEVGFVEIGNKIHKVYNIMTYKVELKL